MNGTMNNMLKLRISALLLTFAALIWGGQALKADGVAQLESDGNGNWYAVIPTSGDPSSRVVNTLTLQDANLPSFKVYDHNGPNGTSYSEGDGALVITAPTGYVLQVTGTLTTGYIDYFHVFNGDQVLNKDQKINTVFQSSPAGQETDIGTVISSSNVITLRFESDYGDTKKGPDLTVTLIDKTPHSISVEGVADGNVIASPAQAAVNTDITLNSIPNTGYRMTDLRIADGLGNDIAVDWSGSFSNSATFKMSSSNVLVTPRFTNNLTAEGGLFVNMPKTGTVNITATQLAGVSSFKVYDDGGRDGDYSYDCDGTLTLTAPQGYTLQLSGTCSNTGSKNAFYVYNGIGTNGDALVNGEHSTSGSSLNVSANSTGQSLTLRFVTSDYEAPRPGLDLTVRVYDSQHIYAIGKGSITDGGDISFKVGGHAATSAHSGELVTVSATKPLGYDFDGIRVTYSSGKTVTMEKSADTEAEFTMPGEAVTVTPIFTLVPDAVNYINADGNQESCTRYTVLESSEGNVEISDQWVVVKGNVTINGTLNLTNTGCNLILCDGATLTISASYNGINATSGTLNIYVQSAGTGTLNVTSELWEGINAASITISGGNITAQSNSSIAISGKNGVTINGGNVSATSRRYKGIYSYSGRTTLGWRKPTDSITINKYKSGAYIKDGQAMTDGTYIYIGKQELLSDGSYAIDGKTLQPAVKITLPTGVTATGTIMHGGDSYAQPGATVTLAAASGYVASDYASTDVNITESDGVYSFEVPANDVTISATCTAADTFVIPANQAALNGVTKFWATFYHSLGNYQLPDGAMALTMDSNKQLFVVGNGNIVPAATAVVIMADASALDANGKLVLTETTETATPVEGNKLEGTSAATATTNLVSGTQKVYVLSKVGEDFGFFQFEGTLNANKAYFIDN